MFFQANTQTIEKTGSAYAPRLKSLLEQPAKSRYQVLAASDFTGVYTCDATGIITYFNQRAADLWGRRPALGVTDERFNGAHMLYRVDGSFLPHDQCPMAEVLAGKVSGVYDAEVQVERPDGSRVIVILNIAPLIDDEGVIVGAVNSFCEKPLDKRLIGEPASDGNQDRHGTNVGRRRRAVSWPFRNRAASRAT
jgi:PAS domain-containing protein